MSKRVSYFECKFAVFFISRTNKAPEKFDVCPSLRQLIALGMALAYVTTGEVVNTAEFTFWVKRQPFITMKMYPSASI